MRTAIMLVGLLVSDGLWKTTDMSQYSTSTQVVIYVIIVAFGIMDLIDFMKKI